MTRILNAASNILLGSNYGALVDEEPLWCGTAWNYYRRSERAATDPANFFANWPRGSYLLTDPAVPGMTCQEAESNWLLQWAAGNVDGHDGQKFILGTVKDSNGVVVAGAVVKAYLTANDVEAGSTTSGIDGTYQCPTPYTGNHYCVAYLAGGTPTAGTTVNTLAPTNIDGT